VLINAIDDPQVSLQLVELAKEHFPHLQIISRARDVDHYIQLRQAGVEAPERETFEAALKSGRMALEALGLALMKRASAPTCSVASTRRWWRRWWRWRKTTRLPAWRSLNAPAHADRNYQRGSQSFVVGSASRLAGNGRGRHTGISPMNRRISLLPEATTHCYVLFTVNILFSI
jgi:hypothetical protein